MDQDRLEFFLKIFISNQQPSKPKHSLIIAKNKLQKKNSACKGIIYHYSVELHIRNDKYNTIWMPCPHFIMVMGPDFRQLKSRK
jgi:hypothetical protein